MSAEADDPPLFGWKAIAAFMQLGESTCRRLAQRRRDRLPVHRHVVRGRMAHRDELRAWEARQVVREVAAAA